MNLWQGMFHCGAEISGPATISIDMNKVFAAPPRTERELKSLHRRVVRKITAMSPAERMATIVSAGIVTKNGKRTKKYGG